MTKQEYWTKSLEYGAQREKEAINWLERIFSCIIRDIQLIPFDPVDNTQNRLYGDIRIVTRDGEEIRIEVKSRTRQTDDLCFEVFKDDTDRIRLVEKRVHYYLFLLPGRQPILVDYMIFQQLFYNSLCHIGHVKKNKYDNGMVIFVPIDAFTSAYRAYLGY